MGKTTVFYNIQSLRGIAALLVVMHHVLPQFKAMDLSNIVIEAIGKHGFMGVDIFFVISGFVMAKTSIGRTQGTATSFQFLTKRFSRIYLGFWPVFVLVLLYYNYFDPGFLESKHIWQSFLLINANMFDLVISPAWSLTYELYFYILVAFTLLSIKLKAQVIFPVLILMVVLKNFVIPLGNNPFLDFFFSSLLLEFISGYFLFYFLDRLSNKKFIYLAVLLCVLFLGLATFFNIGVGYFRVLTFGVFAFSLVWLFLILEINKLWVFSGLIKSIGDASYTLYLIHFVLIGIFYTSGLRVFLVQNNFAFIGLSLYVVAIIVISIIFYKNIELPLYQFAKRKLMNKGPFP